MKRQRWTMGAVVRIPLSTDKFAFGVLLKQPMIAFLSTSSDAQTFEGPVTDDQILLKACVDTYIISKGHWIKVGKVDLSTFDSSEPIRYVYDTISDCYFLYHGSWIDTSYLKPCTKEVALQHDRAAVWNLWAIIERLEKALVE
ncbi:Imm26 family immunity protein [Epibacterium ulvae]|uniref:Imm26 family immunity protein n=1 Tax=Epibacterium ulvae TaxID=1156985 RepID=UPI002491ABA7|nr:Imm26 family immunity protein [Epibacterium ulvae]